MPAMLRGTLVILAAFYACSCSRNSFPTSMRNGQLLHKVEKQDVTNLQQRQKLRSQKYIVQLYKTLSHGQRLPFGAQFVRSFPGTGKTVQRITVLNSHLRIPLNEDILYVILHFCLRHRTLYKISLLKVTDTTTGKTVTQVGSQLKYGRCLEVEMTEIIKARRMPETMEIPISLKVRIKGGEGLQSRELWSYWNGTFSQENEIVVFSRTVEALPPITRRHAKELSRTVKKRGVVGRKDASLTKGCYKKSMIVNFASLGYSNIIAPTIFDAGQCIGQCQYPLGRMSNPTQHSLIQQLLHSLYGDRVAKSTCCSPRGFLPLTAMINDKYSGRAAIRTLEDMIVSECGCV